MAINLQVIGLFFNQNVEVDTGITGFATVEAIMNQARADAFAGKYPGVTAFAYSADSNSVSTIVARYDENVKSRVIGNVYPPGIYFMAENLHERPAYTVWQYYRFNADGTPVKLSGPPLPYNDPNALVQDGGTLIWRLVSILAGPNPASPAVEARLGLKARAGDKSTPASVYPLSVDLKTNG